jgi:hypothetical protein
MQRREQQRRTASGSGSGYLGVGGGVSGYSPLSRFEALESTPVARNSSPVPASSLRPPNFKGTGMKLGSKRTKQAELLDALGGAELE